MKTFCLIFSLFIFLYFQGQSVYNPTKVVMDISSCFQPAQAYVMLSRCQTLDQVFILDKLDPAKLKINQGAYGELKRLEMISINRNPSSWYRKGSVIHVASFNCAGLLPHITDMRMDQKLLNADLILVQETSLFNDELGQASCQIPGYHGFFASVGNGKGVAAYARKRMDIDNIKEANFQISTLKGEGGVDIFNVYRSHGANDAKVMEALRQKLDEG